MRAPLRAEFQFTARHLTLAFAIAAVAGGFAAGAFVVGPVFSDESSADEAADRVAARFERRSVDVAAVHPEPFPYRTPTPDFGLSGTPNYGAIARQNAQMAAGGRERVLATSTSPWAALASEPRETPAPAARTAPRDRHTGVAY